MTTLTKTKNTTPNYKLPTRDDDHRCLSTHTHPGSNTRNEQGSDHYLWKHPINYIKPKQTTYQNIARIPKPEPSMPDRRHRPHRHDKWQTAYLHYVISMI